MTTKIVKIASKTNPDFTKQRNVCNITIPSSLGFVDLESSYLELKCEVDTTTAGIHNVFFGDVNALYSSGCLIKNAHLKTDKQGIVEEAIGINIINENLQALSLTDEMSMSKSFCGDYADIDIAGRLHTVFRQLNYWGNTVSVERPGILKIPLRQLFGLCKGDSMNLLATGNMDVNLEFEDVKTVLTEIRSYTDHATSPLGCGDVAATGAAADVTTLITTGNFTASTSRLFVGQSVNVQYTIAPAAATTANVVVFKLEDDAGKMKVTFTTTLVNTADAITAITIIQNPAATINYKITQADLVVYQNLLTPQQIKNEGKQPGVEYECWAVERVNMASVLNFQRQYVLEQNCLSAVFLTPQTSGLVSVKDNYKNYRLILNGENMTDRVVEDESALYVDRIKVSMANMGMSVNNYMADNMVIPTPIPQIAEDQILQLDLNFSVATTAKIVYLYKKVEKVLKY